MSGPLRSQEGRQRGRIEALEAALREANDVLRSAAEVAKRDGRETNWSALRARLSDVLYEQHRLMVTDHDKTCGVPACLAWSGHQNTASGDRADGLAQTCIWHGRNDGPHGRAECEDLSTSNGAE